MPRFQNLHLQEAVAVKVTLLMIVSPMQIFHLINAVGRPPMCKLAQIALLVAQMSALQWLARES